MAIYRGPGGSGDAVNDSSSETRLAVEARDAALAAQAAAEAAQAAAETAETNAETAETNAETAETNAETAATNAASSASSASSSASAASTSATNAASSASSASTSATNAASSASSASTSASNASTSATNAASSASSASSSATSAASSASSASTSASTATTKASEASTSATNAASSASSASSSASTATTQAGIATTKASEASTSATNAASSASSASTSATNAASSASSASTSATNASNSATAASSAQSAAEAARDAALSAYDNFDDRYLGPKASAPTLDNDGNALVAGALYFNTSSNVMNVYTGSSWVAAYVSAAGVLLQANNLSDLASASTARTNLGLGTAATTAATDYATAAQGAKADTALQSADIGVSVQGYDADLGAIAALSGTSGLLKKTAANTWSLDTTAYLSGTVGVANGGTGLTSLTAGYIPFGAGTSAFGSSSSLFWDNTNKRLGVGTTSPQGQLVASNSGAEGLEIDSTAVAGTSRLLAYNRTTSAEIPLQLRGSIQTFLTAATERMRIDSSGNVGIGTSSPTAKLDVYTSTNPELRLTSASDGYLQIGQFTNGAYIGTSSSDAVDGILRFGTGGSEKMRLDSSGNLGLGVTPSAWASTRKAIQITPRTALAGSTNSTYLGYNWYQGGVDQTYIATAAASLYEQAGGQHAWYNAPSGTAGNAISFTQAMTLDASGNLIIGGTTANQKLQVTGTGPVGIRIYDTNSNNWDIVNNSYLSFTRGSTEAMRIDSSGNVGIGTSSPSGRLHVNSSGAAIAYIQSTLVAGNTNVETRYISTNRTWGVGQNIIQTSSVFEIADVTANATRLAIDSSGNVGIGTSSPTNFTNSKVLEVAGGTNTGAVLASSNSGTVIAEMQGNNGDGLVYYGSRTNHPVVFRANGIERLRVGTSGQLGIGGANYGTSGQVLTSGGSGAAPSWATPSGITTTTGSAPYYGARAWVNFNGFNTPSIRASGNVSSITDNGTGDYTINFSTAMPDGNYAVSGSAEAQSTGTTGVMNLHYSVFPSTSSFRIQTQHDAGGLYDYEVISCVVHR